MHFIVDFEFIYFEEPFYILDEANKVGDFKLSWEQHDEGQNKIEKQKNHIKSVFDCFPIKKLIDIDDCYCDIIMIASFLTSFKIFQ